MILLSPATGCEPDHSEGNFGSGVAVGSRPPSEPKARKKKTSAWRPKLRSPIKFQVRTGCVKYRRSPVIAFLAVICVATGQQIDRELKGRILDQSGSPIAGATLTLTNGLGFEKFVTSTENGDYVASKLRPGEYSVSVVATGYAPQKREGIIIGAGVTSLDMTLTVALDREEVTVVSSLPLSLGTITLTEEDLDHLSDGPSLEAFLRMLTASTNPRGAKILVDGFKRRRLPRKNSIREIRISENPFSAEYDEPGQERVEILTKPGSDQFHAGLFYTFNDASMNSRNPFADERAPFQSRLLRADFGGPLVSDRASFLLDFERTDTEGNAVIHATTLNSDLNLQPIRLAVVTPGHRTTYRSRFDYQLDQRNTLVAKYDNTEADSRNAGVGDFSLLSRAYENENSEHVL